MSRPGCERRRRSELSGRLVTCRGVSSSSYAALVEYAREAFGARALPGGFEELISPDQPPSKRVGGRLLQLPIRYAARRHVEQRPQRHGHAHPARSSISFLARCVTGSPIPCRQLPPRALLGCARRVTPAVAAWWIGVPGGKSAPPSSAFAGQEKKSGGPLDSGNSFRDLQNGGHFRPPPSCRRLQNQATHNVSTVARRASDLNVFANGRGRFAKWRGPPPDAGPCGCPLANSPSFFCKLGGNLRTLSRSGAESRSAPRSIVMVSRAPMPTNARRWRCSWPTPNGASGAIGT
jgi:hypothetical protein